MAAMGGALILTLLAAAVLVAGWRRIRETTLVSAWCWSAAAFASLALLALVEQMASSEHDAALDAWRFVAAVLTFCPVVSLLGAKRPQDAAWNFVVLSLLVVAALPAAETLFMQRGQRLEVGAARGWFLWILVLLGPINFLPTKHGLSALLLMAAQVILLGEQLPLIRRSLLAEQSLAALTLSTLAMVVAWWRSRSATVATTGYDRLWIDFRNAFGLLWALRVQERVNAAATMYDWPIVLAWSGFRQLDDGAPLTSLDEAVERQLRQNLKGLLRRFVSAKWIGERSVADVD